MKLRKLSKELLSALKEGEIIEKGTHEELLELNGRYKMLYDGVLELD